MVKTINRIRKIMNQNIAHHKKKEFISKPLKFVIAAASLAGTLGLWGIFSKADVQNAVTQPTTDATLPTVATLVSVDSNSIAANSSSSTSLDVLPVITQAPLPVVTAAPIINQPVPITRSRTSH
jgi:hypothetical protein